MIPECEKKISTTTTPPYMNSMAAAENNVQKMRGQRLVFSVSFFFGNENVTN